MDRTQITFSAVKVMCCGIELKEGTNTLEQLVVDSEGVLSKETVIINFTKAEPSFEDFEGLN